MKLRKVLAVVLCVAAVIGVMAAVAIVSHAAQAAAVPNDAPSALVTTATAPTTTKSSLSEWWNSFYPGFDQFYKGAFAGVQQFLLLLFNMLLKIVGLR
ncbi:MAG: hypothetical protein LBG83_05890 [Oscillospiraceae bacterium]|jgi:hypothetical protein|nr:hypothetical protein [Oscillospiraceae bacterium]